MTKTVMLPLDAKLSNGVIIVTGSLDITWPTTGISTAASVAILSVADHGSLELQLFFTK